MTVRKLYATVNRGRRQDKVDKTIDQEVRKVQTTAEHYNIDYNNGMNHC